MKQRIKDEYGIDANSIDVKDYETLVAELLQDDSKALTTDKLV